jgi:hypothetical protein
VQDIGRGRDRATREEGQQDALGAPERCQAHGDERPEAEQPGQGACDDQMRRKNRVERFGPLGPLAHRHRAHAEATQQEQVRLESQAEAKNAVVRRPEGTRQEQPLSEDTALGQEREQRDECQVSAHAGRGTARRRIAATGR